MKTNLNILLFLCWFLPSNICTGQSVKTLAEKNNLMEGFADFGTHKLNYYSKINAKKTLIVFENGLGGDIADWLQHDMISKIGDKADVVLYNRSGYGESTNFKGNHSIEKLSEDLKQLISKINQNQDIILVGHSYGGLLVRFFAVNNPKNIKAIVLLDPSDERIFDKDVDKTEKQLVSFYRLTKGKDDGATQEASQFEEAILQAKELKLLPDIPVVVLTNMPKENEAGKKNWAAHEQIGKNIKNFKHLKVTSGHNINRNEPLLLLNTISALIDL